MNIPNENDVVIFYWAIGPSYRTYLIKNLEAAMKYSSAMGKFAILTDHREDFSDLCNSTDKCLTVLDLDEERKNYTWSFELEPVPQQKTEPEYGLEFRKNLLEGKRFSYSLNRFVIPWCIRNNVTKFFISDPDAHLGIHRFNTFQDYLNEITTHIALMEENNTPKENSIGRVIGVRPSLVREKINDTFHDLLCSITGTSSEYPNMYPQLDGIFKYYDFNTTSDLQIFFDTWNSARKIEIDPENTHLYGTAHGGVFLNDEVLLGAIFHALNIDVYGYLIHNAAYLRGREENRWFAASIGVESDSLDDFIEKNKNLYKNKLYDFSDIY